MGKRVGRKLTREVKAQMRQDAINSVIGVGLKGGEPFQNIARYISMDFHIDKNKALSMVMAESKVMAKSWLDLDAQTHHTDGGQAGVNL